MAGPKKKSTPAADSEKLFGTDGIRGLANQAPMTGEIAMNVGRAVAHVLRHQKVPLARTSLPVGLKPLESKKQVRRVKIVVGKDTRLSGYMIEHALAVAFITQNMRADAGIMLSASHNPYHDNGIKIFSADGYKLPDAVEDEIERLVNSDELKKELVTGNLVGKAFRIDDLLGRYLVFLKNLFPPNFDLMGLRVAIDCANGAAYKVGPMVFEELGAEVIKKGVEPNGININENCGALHPETLSSTVLSKRADIGISLDGDGDRCILIDEKGEVVDGDQIIGLCALEMARKGELVGNTVVTTPMSNIGLEVALQKRGIKMVRASVGDRHVVDMMRKNGWVLGGALAISSSFVPTTGDGIVAALKVLEAMRHTGKKLSELKKSIQLFPQVREDIRVSRKEPFDRIPDILKAIKAAETKLREKGRVFVRYSGTEPVARVMVEGENLREIQTLSRSIAGQIQRHLG